MELGANSKPFKMTFRVVDEKGKKIAESMDLDSLKFELKERVQESISAVADDAIEQSGVHIWNFAELPQFYEQKKHGFSVKAFPAIVDEKSLSVLNFLKRNLNKR
ncbi:ATP-dependent RNA helicase HrpA [Rodentibacter pneumotropicus]|uniref:ATP-dependent RNA helicase HrpA n=1 Tax=Rodentibacter pneumotropicus TaxID=758 RepID=A0A448MS70_9PAST|nr:ATP-dependent RNA helicase HrpA [Rodentibacter pneumotropicus]